MYNLIHTIYGPDLGPQAAEQLRQIIDRHRARAAFTHHTVFQGRFSQGDSILISYGDQVTTTGQMPLQTLAEFIETNLIPSRPFPHQAHNHKPLLTGIHILPFYPYSSDDGFSVIDYRQVDPALGSWDEIEKIGRHFGLMFDAVINHISVQSDWFQGFVRNDPVFSGFFITPDQQDDLSQVVRPRALPLLTVFNTTDGPRQVWTTFSADQVDLNYANPAVLLAIIDLLLFYVSKGAEVIRLDAIAYLWKQPGTSCIHMDQTHQIIRLFRAVFDEVAPQVLLITETNVPHHENVSYFGNGKDEAQLVYNFALPPLVLHTLQTGSAHALSHWASGLAAPSTHTTFFNFLASHDGVGLNPVREILTPAEIDQIIHTVEKHQGLVSYKHNSDGSQSPYELNISYFDALSDPNGEESLDLQIARFLAAHAIQLSIIGVPGIYFHSLFGSRSWLEGVQQTGRNRTINRQKLDRTDLEQALGDPGSLRSQVFNGLAHLLRTRAGRAAFDPYGQQVVQDGGASVLALWRSSPDGSDRVLCLQNVTAAKQPVSREILPESGVDLLSGNEYQKRSQTGINLQPYQTIWLASPA